MYGLLRVALSVGVVYAASTLPVHADVFHYKDGSGKSYFTDTPLKGNRYKLQWQRESRKLVSKSNQAFIQDRSDKVITAKGRVISSKSTPLSGSASKRRADIEHLVTANARRYRLSPALLHAVIRAESAYNHRAVSHAGAQGLMQLMPATAARYGVRDSFDPADNIRGGSAYLRFLLDLFDQDVKLAVAGYNAGEGAVLKYGRSIPPYSETQAYVRKVLKFYGAERPTSFIMSAR